MWTLGFILFVWTIGVGANTIAYDCQDQNTEMSKVSLLSVKPCLDPRNNSRKEEVSIQLVQKKQFDVVEVFTCLVVVQELIHHCGFLSHIGVVDGGYVKSVHTIGKEACLEAHKFGNMNLKGLGAGIISKLKENGTTELSVTLRGDVDLKGNCQGVKYTVGTTTYEDVIVTAAISIKMKTYLATADIERDVVHLQSQTICSYQDGYCFADEEGEVAFKPAYKAACSETGVDVLYQGKASLLTIETNPVSQYIIVESETTTFALKFVKLIDLCAQAAWQTEENRLLVLIGHRFYFQKRKILPHNTDLMGHIVSKLLYMDIKFDKKYKDLIFDAILKRCQLREKILQNRITLALQSPHVVGNLIKQTPGYVSRVMGEVLYIAKCKPVIVEIRRTESCYQELPVTFNNKSMFRTPMSHILTEFGTEVDCQPLLPPNFFIEDRWIEMSPRIQKTEPVTILDANDEKEHIELSGISPITSNGIYTKEEMASFQRTLLFPNERTAISNTVARRIMGKTTDDQYYMPNVFSELEFKNLARSAAEEVWGFLSLMGNVFSICGFCYTTFCVISYAASVATNYFSLKKVTNNHPKRKRILLSSLWQNMAHRYMIQLMHRQNQSQENINLESIVVQEEPSIEKEEKERLYPTLAPSAPPMKCNDPSCPDLQKRVV